MQMFALLILFISCVSANQAASAPEIGIIKDAMAIQMSDHNLKWIQK
jgi:hypothetical protein